MKAAQCTRRAGKSFGCGLYLCKEALENPGVSILYIAPTRKSAERILWKDVLLRINRDLHLNMKFDPANLKLTAPNGSIIYLEGADSSFKAKDQFLGQKFKLIVIDEAAKFHTDVEELINDVLMPCLADYEGTMVLIGTTNNFIHSFFARVTMGKEAGWSVHKWSAVDNPHMVRQFTAEIARLKEANPHIEKEAWFRQNYLGEWVVDTQALVYRYDPKTALIQSLPSSDLYCTLGITLSYTGRTGFAVVGYSHKFRAAFIIESFRYEDTDIYRAVETVHRLAETYNITEIICAEASHRLAVELNKRYGLVVKETIDKDKPALIALFNTEIAAGHIKVLPENKDLISEWNSVIMDTRPLVRAQMREHPACVNQTATATLFAWQACYNYQYQAPFISDDPADSHWESVTESLSYDQPDSFDEFYGASQIPE